MTDNYGFELLQTQDVPEINSTARLYRHSQTGARLLSVENDDANKVFGITFRTPPTDSTGLPHIMEHSVLCGSRKYPVKEPFVELVKGSLKTFLNAFTFPDKTCYPVASQNVQDFYNLIDVYFDAVFHPRLTPYVLQQEGWHYELENIDDPLIYKGVVFNEMKGAYASPDSVLGRYIQQSLFPDNTYGVDSGGDPKDIPNLTFEQFQAFHRRYYHPANAYIYFYGDDDPAERLRLTHNYLKEFSPLVVDSAVAIQAPFTQPTQQTYAYAVDQDETNGGKAFVTVNWLLAETLDSQLSLSLAMLAYILTGTPASPLRKALIDSGLGEDITGGGLDSHLRQMTYSTGLKGTATGSAAQIETLILDTLRNLAGQGIEPDMIEAAVNTTEFSLRENNTGSFPRGLLLMLRALSTWLYDGDPVARLGFEAPLAAIKERLAAGEAYFEGLIDQYLLQNQHRTTVILAPDPTLRQRDDAAEKERLAQARAALNETALEAIIENTDELKRRQETPDSPEALAKIPRLTLDDLDPDNKLIPLERLEENESQVLYHDLFTNGIAYLDVGFDLHRLPQELLPYVSLFGQALLKIGTETEDFVKLSQRIGRKTGGIWTSSFTSALKDSAESTAWLFLRGKATMDQVDDLLALLRDMLLTVKLDNQERFKQMVLEAKARKEAGLIPGGHGVIDTRLRAHFNEADWVDEQMSGVTYLFFLRDLAKQVDVAWPSVLEKLEMVRRTLISRPAMVSNVTLDQDNWQQFRPKLAGFLADLPTTPVEAGVWSVEPLPANEGLTIPAQVNYVGKGANLYDLGYRPHGSISVISNQLRTAWLWERVRVQGGAYGAFCTFDYHSGIWTYRSYRDPNLLDTLDVYDRTARFLRELDLSEDELTKSIIGTIGQLDAYQLPDAKGYSSLLRYLAGITDEIRQQRRDEILVTTPAHFKAFADVLEAVSREGEVVVLGSQEAIETANSARDGWLDVMKVL